MSGLVRATRVRSLLRVAGEGREHVSAGLDARKHVLSGLARVLSAEVSVLATGTLSDASIGVDDWLDQGWRTESERTAFHSAYETAPINDWGVGDLSSPSARRVFPPDSIRYDLHRPAGVDASLLSFARSRAGAFRVLVFKREWGVREFDDEDCALVDLFRAEFEHLFAPVHEPELSKRERDVRALLLDGLPEKLIAAQLGLSLHTTHGYIKSLYRKLGVHSRGELMASARRPPV